MSTIPPRAPDLETIFDVETAFEAVLPVLLDDAGIFDAQPERTKLDAKTPRVEVRVMLGACLSRNRPVEGATDPREWLPCAWDITIDFLVITDRNKQTQRAAHGRYRGAVRKFAAEYFTQINARMPYHHLEKLNEAGTTPSLYNQEAASEDITRIRYAGAVTVRATAWPV